jgi:hypothetical protein
MDAVTEHGKSGVTEKVKDILPTHSATSAGKQCFLAANL